jgi:D-alanyl-D-alanine carboxypeptidase
MRAPSFSSYLLWSLFVFAGGGFIAGAPFFLFEHMQAPQAFSFEQNGTAVVYQADTSEEPASATGVYATRVLAQPTFAIPAEGTALFADLAEMMLRVYREGTLAAEYPIASKGKPGSLWETPTGEYAIQTKEENHYSTIGEVWMPYSMQFFGNFFIHGKPTYEDGTPTPDGFSGGCIRLSTEDAIALFSDIELGAPVFVTNGTGTAVVASGREAAKTAGFRGVDSFVPPPEINGRAALVGDLENGFIFFEKNSDEIRPIASLSKLMTGLISVEAVNQFRTVTISKDDVAIYGDAGGLHAGDRIETGELLWPLLLASSNDAAYALARQIGLAQFTKLMNEKTKSLGLSGTRFEEPSGLSPENKSTAIDMFRFVQYLWANKRSLLELTTNRSYKTWRNIHPFVSKDSFLGGKTGYIPEAERTIVSLFSIPFGEFTSRPVAIVALGSRAIQTDVERLRVWVKNNFMYDNNLQQGTGLVEYDVQNVPDKNSAYSLLFTGDIMMNRGVEQVIEQQGNGDWTFPFRFVADAIREADLSFGNLEGPVSDKGANVGSAYSFRMNPQTADALASVGFDVVSLANNHIGDWSREALEDTMRRLHRAKVGYAGAGWNSNETFQPVVYDVRGARVGYLAFSDVGPTWLAADEALSGVAALPAGTAGISLVEKTVLQAAPSADILVVSFHFGKEYSAVPNARQVALAHAAIDAGARVVAGHHPHVVQNVEEYNGGVIAYSLGNFVFDQNFSPETMEGLMLKVEFDSENTIAAVIPIPVKMNEYYQPEIE